MEGDEHVPPCLRRDEEEDLDAAGQGAAAVGAEQQQAVAGGEGSGSGSASDDESDGSDDDASTVSDAAADDADGTDAKADAAASHGEEEDEGAEDGEEDDDEVTVRAPSGRRKAVQNYKELIEKGGRPSPDMKKAKGKSNRGRKQALKPGYVPALLTGAAEEGKGKGKGKRPKKEATAASLGLEEGELSAEAAAAAASGDGPVIVAKVPKPKNKKKRFTLSVLTSGAVDSQSVVIGGGKPGSPRFVLPPNFNKYSRKQRKRLLERQAEAAARAGADAQELAEAMMADPLLARVLAERGVRDDEEEGGGRSKSASPTSLAASPKGGAGAGGGGKKKEKTGKAAKTPRGPSPTFIPVFNPDAPPPPFPPFLPPLLMPFPPGPAPMAAAGAAAPFPSAPASAGAGYGTSQVVGTTTTTTQQLGHAFPPTDALEPRKPPPLEEQVRVARDPEELACSRVLDEEDVPCDAQFAWTDLGLPRLPILPPPANASASRGEVRVDYNYYHYVTEAMWALAGKMHARLGPELARLVLGEAVATLPSLDAVGAWEGPGPEEDPAMVIPPLGTVVAARKRGTDAVAAEGGQQGSQGLAGEEEDDDEERGGRGPVAADLGDGGTLRALWEVMRGNGGVSGGGEGEEERPAKRASRGQGRGQGQQSESPATEAAAATAAEVEGGGEGEGAAAGPPNVFRCDAAAPPPSEEEGEGQEDGRGLLPALRMRVEVEEGSRGLKLQSARVLLKTTQDGEKEADEASASPSDGVDMDVAVEGGESVALDGLNAAVAEEKGVAGRGRLLRFWETSLLAAGRQDRKREKAEERLNGGANKRASSGLPPSASSPALVREASVGGEDASVASGGGGGGATPTGAANGGGRKRRRPGTHPEVGEDEVLSLLVEAQRELMDLMRQNLGPARRVYDAMVAAFESGRAVRAGEKVKERAALRKYVEVLVRAAAAEEADGLNASGHSSHGGWGRSVGPTWMDGVEEVNTECNVCHRSEAGGRNSIVFCDRCNMPVHTFCYCVSCLPAGSWHCQPCEDAILREQEQEAARELEVNPPDPAAPSPPALPAAAAATTAVHRCTLCPGVGGAVRRAARPDAAASAPPSKPALPASASAQENVNAAEGAAAEEEEEEEEWEWAHVECCRWLGLIDGRSGRIPALPPRLRALRRRHGEAYRCAAERCKEPHAGGLVPCSVAGCDQFFHVACGRRNGHEMYHGSRFGKLAWVAHCAKHTDPRRFAATVRRVEASYEPSERELADVNPVYAEVFAAVGEAEEEARRPRPWAAKAPPAVGSAAHDLYMAFKAAADAEAAKERAAESRRKGEAAAARRQRQAAAWGATSALALPPVVAPSAAAAAPALAAAAKAASAATAPAVGGGGGGGGGDNGKKAAPKRGPYRRTRVRAMLSTLQEHGVVPPPKVVEAVDGSGAECGEAEEWVLQNLDAFPPHVRAQLLGQDEVLRGLYGEKHQQAAAAAAGAQGPSGGTGLALFLSGALAGGGGGTEKEAGGQGRIPAILLPPDGYLPPPPPPMPVMTAFITSTSEGELSASAAAAAASGSMSVATAGNGGQDLEGAGSNNGPVVPPPMPSPLPAPPQFSHPLLQHAPAQQPQPQQQPQRQQQQGEEQREAEVDFKPPAPSSSHVTQADRAAAQLPVFIGAAAAAAALNEAPAMLVQQASGLSGLSATGGGGGESSVTTASGGDGNSSVHSGTTEGGGGGGGGGDGKKKRKPPALGPDGKPKKRRAPPGGPYFDEPEYDARGQLKRVQQKGYECEGCGAIIGTKANLDRHRKQSCVVLVKGKPRPANRPRVDGASSLGSSVSVASSLASYGGGGGAPHLPAFGPAAAVKAEGGEGGKGKRSQKKKAADPTSATGAAAAAALPTIMMPGSMLPAHHPHLPAVPPVLGMPSYAPYTAQAAAPPGLHMATMAMPVAVPVAVPMAVPGQPLPSAAQPVVQQQPQPPQQQAAAPAPAPEPSYTDVMSI